MADSITVSQLPQFRNLLAPRHGVITLFGYRIKVYVDRGHLTIQDGIGGDRRAARLPRAQLQRTWFFEQRDGNCRLTSDFAAELSETSPLWRRALGPLAEWIASMLWSTVSRPSREEAPATRLTQRRKREAKGIPTNSPIPIASSENRLIVPKAVRLCAHDPIAQAGRAETQRRQATALKAWKPLHKPNWLDEKFYREKIQPRLAGIEIPALMSVLGISKAYATNICSGMRPHPRHWVNLAHLTGSP